MDYKGEQEMELEALEAILMDDMQPYDGTVPDGWKSAGLMYKIKIDPATEGDEDDADVEYDKSMELIFSHTATYPETAPNFKLRSVQGLSDADIAAGQAVLRQVVEENLGMAMIYTLVGAAKEWLRGKLSGAASMDDDPELEEKKRRDAEEAHRAALRAQGTPVTAETFAAWKARFDAEMAALKAKAAESLKDDDKAKRLTGKAYFQRLAADQMGDDEAGALSDDDEEIFDDDASTATGAAGAATRSTAGATAAEDEDDEDDDEDLDYEDEDEDEDEELLEHYLAAKR